MGTVACARRLSPAGPRAPPAPLPPPASPLQRVAPVARVQPIHHITAILYTRLRAQDCNGKPQNCTLQVTTRDFQVPQSVSRRHAVKAHKHKLLFHHEQTRSTTRGRRQIHRLLLPRVSTKFSHLFPAIELLKIRLAVVDLRRRRIAATVPVTL